MQLTFLTPWFLRWLRTSRARVALYLVTPAVLIIRYLLAFAGHGMGPLPAFCGVWLVFYLVGLEWRSRFATLAERWLPALVGCLAVLLFAQLGEGLLWQGAGNPDMATTQVKLSSVATSLAFCAAAVSLPMAAKSVIARLRPLVVLGDLLFGIYLCHMLFVAVAARLLPTAEPLGAVVAFAASLAGSALFVAAVGKHAPASLRRVLGC